MTSHVVQELTDAEFAELSNLYEKKIALENLMKIIDSTNEAMYNKLVADYGSTLHIFNNWWDKKKLEYNWDGSSFHLDFETHEIVCTE